MTKKFSMLALAASLFLLAGNASALTIFQVGADLSPTNVNTSPTPSSSGSGELNGFGGSISLVGNFLLFDLQWEDLTSTALSVSIHGPTSVSDPADWIWKWNLSEQQQNANQLVGKLFNVSQTNLQYLMDGELYVQVCTEDFSCRYNEDGTASGQGELRGQILSRKLLASHHNDQPGPSVPEPSAALVFAVGLGVIGRTVRKRR